MLVLGDYAPINKDHLLRSLFSVRLILLFRKVFYYDVCCSNRSSCGTINLGKTTILRVSAARPCRRPPGRKVRTSMTLFLRSSS
jgi:hypothetical protein